MTTISFLLDRYLSDDRLAIRSTHSIYSILDQLQPLRIHHHLSSSIDSQNQHQRRPSPAELNRWFDRIHSLLDSNDLNLNSLGTRLAQISLDQDLDHLAINGPRWLIASHRIILRASRHPSCLSQAIHLTLSILHSSIRWPQFAREHCDSKAITNLSKTLITLAEDESIQDPRIRSLLLRTLATLVTRYASILRPLGSRLESITLRNLLNPVHLISRTAVEILIQLYRLSPRLDTPTSWSKTVKSIIGTIDILLDTVLSPFLTEFDSARLPNPTQDRLPPLEIPLQDLLYPSSDLSQSPINSDDAHSASCRIPLILHRIDRFIRALIAILSQPTDQPVDVPIGELSALACRLLLLGKANTREGADLNWKLAWDALGGTINARAMGCRLMTKVAHCLGIRFTPFSTYTLSILASELLHQASNSSSMMNDTSIIYQTYAFVLSSCPANPTTVQTTLEPVIKLVLQDLQHIYGRLPSSSDGSHPDTSDHLRQPSSHSKKPKRKSQRHDFDSSSWNSTVVVDPLGLRVVERALTALEILIRTVPHFFPPPYLTVAVQTLLSLASHPSFISPIRKTNLGSNQPNTSALNSSTSLPHQRSPDLAYIIRPNLRVKILSCLIGSLTVQRTSNQPIVGLNLAQSLIGILQNLSSFSHHRDSYEGQLSNMARVGLETILLMIRPRVPPIFPTLTQSRMEEDAPLIDSSSDEVERQGEGDQKVGKTALQEKSADVAHQRLYMDDPPSVEGPDPRRSALTNPIRPHRSTSPIASQPPTILGASVSSNLGDPINPSLPITDQDATGLGPPSPTLLDLPRTSLEHGTIPLSSQDPLQKRKSPDDDDDADGTTNGRPPLKRIHHHQAETADPSELDSDDDDRPLPRLRFDDESE